MTLIIHELWKIKIWYYRNIHVLLGNLPGALWLHRAHCGNHWFRLWDSCICFWFITVDVNMSIFCYINSCFYLCKIMSWPVFYCVVCDYKFNKVLLKIIYFSSLTLLAVFLLSFGHAVLKCKEWKLLQLVNGVTGCRTGAWFSEGEYASSMCCLMHLHDFCRL